MEIFVKRPVKIQTRADVERRCYELFLTERQWIFPATGRDYVLVGQAQSRQ